MPSITSSAKQSTQFSPEACIFIANLPARHTNDELNYRLGHHMGRFGPVASIKVSRDSHGRPYGFVQFMETKNAKDVLKRNLEIIIGGRTVRVEKARCLRKLQISVSLLSTQNITEIVSTLKRYAEPQNIIQVDHESPGEFDDGQLKPKYCFNIVLKEDLDADAAFNELCSVHHDWKVEWLSSMPRDEYMSFSDIFCMNRVGYRDYPPCSPAGILDSFESLALTNDHSSYGPGSPLENADSLEREMGCDIFIGRLNPHKVDEDGLRRRFAIYGDILSLTLVNKRKSAGIPQDAFAFITYEKPESAVSAIAHENGSHWLGQAIKINYAQAKVPPLATPPPPGYSPYQTHPYYTYPQGIYAVPYPDTGSATPIAHHGGSQFTGGHPYPIYGYPFYPTPFGFIPMAPPRPYPTKATKAGGFPSSK